MCESDVDGDGLPDQDVIDGLRVGSAGEQGAWQVLARYHGPVPLGDFEAQTIQARAIYERQGWRPWACAS